METALAVTLGIALAAACGFRVFVPLLVLGLGVRVGLVHVGDHFAWISTWPALTGLGVATVLEVVAYFWPWLDHALDVAASPAAVVAGTMVAASQFYSVDPALAWPLGLVAGGGAAGLTQAATVSARGVSTAVTGGLLNPVINAVQSVVATVLAVLAVVVPIAAGLLGLIALTLLVLWWRRRSRRLGVHAARPCGLTHTERNPTRSVGVPKRLPWARGSS